MIRLVKISKPYQTKCWRRYKDIVTFAYYDENMHSVTLKKNSAISCKFKAMHSFNITTCNGFIIAVFKGMN